MEANPPQDARRPCPYCGEMILARAIKCRFCNEDLVEGARKVPSVGDDAGLRMLLPVGRSLWAIAAGYLGLFSVLGVFAPISVVVSIIAIRQLKQHPELHGMGRAIFGLVMGLLGTAILIAILASLFVR